MDDESLYRKIQDALNEIPGNFNILEEQIDIQLQMEYFEFVKKFREGPFMEEFLGDEQSLKDPNADLNTRKKILAALASVSDVEAFRTIERYLKHPDPELKDWAILALQESRMLLQSSLLEEQQVFISTGLGGKGQKLRYFLVFINQSGGELSAMQKKLLQDELTYAVEKNDGEVEEFNHMIDFNTAMVVLPVKAMLKDVFKGVIEECNQYGNFLTEDMVITNVKRLSPYEILELLNDMHTGNASSEEENLA